MGFNISKYRNMEEQTFKCEIVTPLFLGGADQVKAELRPASIKGMLRFWWRALYGTNDLDTMRKRESELFGNTEKKSTLQILLKHDEKGDISQLRGGRQYQVQSSRMNRPATLSIFDYLAYGLCQYERSRGNVYNKAHLEPGKRFDLTLRFPRINEKDILGALEAMIRFGGLGAKSRNGFGCLHVTDLPKTDILKEYENTDPKDFTSFSKNTRLFTFKKRESWQEALSDVGLAYREARLDLEDRHKFDKRSHVAIPIIAQGEGRNIPSYAQNGRHSKSYFLHVSKSEDNKYQGQILYLPYNYHPQNRRDDYIQVYGEMNEKIRSIIKGGHQ